MISEEDVREVLERLTDKYAGRIADDCIEYDGVEDKRTKDEMHFTALTAFQYARKEVERLLGQVRKGRRQEREEYKSVVDLFVEKYGSKRNIRKSSISDDRRMI